MLKNKNFLLWIIFTAVIATITSLALPMPAGEDAGLRVTLGLSLSMCLLQIGALVTFSSSLHTFTHTLRRGYYLLLVGFLLFSMIALMLPLFVIFNVDSPLVQVLILVFYLGSAFVIYLSMHKFASLLNIHHFMTSLPLIVGASFTVGVGSAIGASYLVAMLTGGEPNFSSAIMGIIIVFLTAATFIAGLLRKTIGALYLQAMHWLYWGLLLLTISTYHEFFTKLLLPGDSWYLASGISFWPYVAASVVILAASFVFKSNSAMVVTYTGAKNHVDVLMSLVSFASRPSDIDKLLDEVRAITASLPVGEKLSEEKKTQLIHIYLKVEKYLETEDPLHRFTQEELRNNLPTSFAENLQRVEAHKD